jgi:hypothetical protein
MIAIRLPSILFATALVAIAAGSAEARDRLAPRSESHHHRQHAVENNRWDRHGDGRHNRPSELSRSSRLAAGNDTGRGGYHGNRSRDVYGNSISIIGGLGTYVGNLDVTRDRGNGIYFMRDGYGWAPQAQDPAAVLAPKAKIIDVEQAMASGNPFAPRNACSYENGVCVIRGGQ